MPYSNPEKQKEAMREINRRARKRKKAEKKALNQAIAEILTIKGDGQSHSIQLNSEIIGKAHLTKIDEKRSIVTFEVITK